MMLVPYLLASCSVSNLSLPDCVTQAGNNTAAERHETTPATCNFKRKQDIVPIFVTPVKKRVSFSKKALAGIDHLAAKIALIRQQNDQKQADERRELEMVLKARAEVIEVLKKNQEKK